MKKLALLLGLTIFLLSFGVVWVFSFNIARAEIKIDTSGIQFSPIEIKDLNINVIAGQNQIEGSFTLRNRSTNPLSEIGYTVRLLEKAESVGIVENLAGRDLISYQSSKEFFYYSSQEERQFQFSLNYPPAIKSTAYNLTIGAHDKLINYYGTIVRDVILSGSNALIDLEAQDCFIFVHDVKFSLNEGPPVEPNQEVPVICKIKNPSSRAVTLTPQAEVGELMVIDFANSAYSQKYTLPDFRLEPKETKDVTFVLKAPSEAKTYNIILTLLDENKKEASNKLSLRYVVRGEGARIQKIELDKTFYRKGEQAKVSVSYYGSSDLHWEGQAKFSYPVSSLKAEIMVTILGRRNLDDSQEVICGEDKISTETVDTAFGTVKSEVAVSIIRDCYNPLVKAVIGEEGKIYSQSQLALKTLEEDLRGLSQKKVGTGVKYIIIIISVALVLSVIFYRRLRSKSTSQFILFLFILLFGFLGFSEVAKAGRCISLDDPVYGLGIVGNSDNFVMVRAGHWDPGAYPPQFGCGVVIKDVYFSNAVLQNNQLQGTLNLVSIDLASDNQDYHEFVALTYYIKKSDGSFIKTPNTSESFIKIVQIEDPSGGSSNGTQHAIPFSINIADIKQDGHYTVYIDVRPAMYVPSLGILPPRYGQFNDNYIADSDYDEDIFGGAHQIYFYNYTWWANPLEFMNQNRLKVFVEPFCTLKYQGFGSCPTGAPHQSSDLKKNLTWYYIPPVVRKFVEFDVGFPVPTLSFSASPTQITQGQSSTLNWSSSNVNSCIIDQGIGSVGTSGSRQVSPSVNTTYTLSCSGPQGSASQSAAITVIPAPSLSFSANPAQIIVGGSSTLSWSSQNVTSCSASGQWSGAKPVSGSQSVTLSSIGAYTYTLTCTGPGGSATRSATINVKTAPQFQEI